jgi:hypothetical protein
MKRVLYLFLMCLLMNHILHFGELKIRFQHIVPFVYRKYILNNFGRLELVFVCDLKYIQIPHFPRVISTDILIGNISFYI